MFKTIRDIVKIPDLRRRILYTLMMLALVRLGSLIPSPLMDAAVVKNYFASAGGVMALFDIMSGNAFSNMNLFAMGIQPYINASIIISLLTVAIPKLEELQKEGESGRKKISQYTRVLTVALALLQSFGISYGLRSGFTSDLGTAWSIIVSMSVFTAGSVFVMWIGENITEKGIGNGISLIIMINVLSRVPSAVGALVSYENYWMLGVIVVILVLVVAFIVVLELAERRIPIQYAKRMQGRKTYGGSSTYIPIRVNMAGVIPIIFAISIMSLPGIITGFVTATPTGWWATTLRWLNTAHPFGACLYVVLIIFFTYFYASITYNPRDIADNLKKNGGFIPGFRPGAPTLDYLKKTSHYVVFIGAIMLAIVASIPVILSFVFKIDNLSIGGSSLMICIGVALETVKQIEGQMVMRHYKGFLSK
ncbi:MAG: preprotein translocase subunit SecY [Lachnospiraceae bacterium]|nr:preprotein translocase subunit SecY [Lachnospiraceae bacterium]